MKNYLTILLFLYLANAFAQEHAWVYFNDKPDATSALENPLSMLSQRALDRRDRQGIPLDYKDVPLSNAYYNQIANQPGIIIRAKSKWLNALHIYGSEDNINALIAISFVKKIQFAAKNLQTLTKSTFPKKIQKNKFSELTDFNYGGSYNQANQIRVDYLHENNFTGSSMLIAVLDAGFSKVNTLNAFQRIRDNNQILGGYNYVERSTDFYKNHSHGTSVLSTIGGFVEGQLVGTAPDAKFYLFTTEDVTSETPLEESLWVEAAEKSDSLGVDIINTSLGYRDFDDSRYDHLYSDMDGKTTFMARGANIAAERGMLIVASAGNSGNNSYYNIGTPADATNVFTIGAVDANGNMASFSSYGPNFSNQVKPDVCAKGVATTLINLNDDVVTGNGTSFSSPVMAGAIACLWEAYPNKTNFEIMQIVRESAHLFDNPTSHQGFGIPNMEFAFTSMKIAPFENIHFYPNPTKNKLHIHSLNDTTQYSVKIFDVLGNFILKQPITNNTVYLQDINSGIYILQISDTKNTKQFKFMKY